MFQRKWKAKTTEAWTEITEDRVNRELANAHGDNAAAKLKEAKELSTQYGIYRFVA